MTTKKNKFSAIKLLLLDVDGVLTDGKISYIDDGREIKSFDVQDGAGIKYWIRGGGEVGIITGRNSNIVKRRADELDIKYLHQGAKNKLPCLKEILSDSGLDAENICYVGDDLPDIPVMRECGLSFTVANGVKEAKDVADFTTKKSGGYGAVREIIEIIMKEQGKWDSILSRYF